MSVSMILDALCSKFTINIQKSFLSIIESVSRPEDNIEGAMYFKEKKTIWKLSQWRAIV